MAAQLAPAALATQSALPDIKITKLPQVPIRYSGSVPSMSRRGGIRLHPIKDGSLNPAAHTEQIRRRDIGGNKLVDVINPDTGFCVGTRSLMESVPNFPAGQIKPTRPAISGQPSGLLKLLPDTRLTDSSTGERVYLDDTGHRIRTTAMGEAPLPAVPANARPDTSPKPAKRVAGDRARAPKRITPGTLPGTRTGTGRITDDDVRDYLRALYRAAGKKAPATFSKQHMFLGRQGLATKIAKARKALGGQ